MTKRAFAILIAAALLIGASAGAYKPQCKDSSGRLIVCSGNLDNAQAPTSIAASTLTGSIDVARLPSAVQNANDLTSPAQAQINALSADVALATAGGNTFYLQEVASDIATYETLRTQPSSDPEDFDEVIVNAGTSPLLLDAYATDASVPGIAQWPAGNWIFHTHATVDSNGGDTRLVASVYSRTSGGVETLLFSATSPELDIGVTEYQWNSVESQFSLTAQTDRLVVKFFVTTTSVGNRTVRIYYQSATRTSYVTTPIPSPLPISGSANRVLATPNGSTGATSLRALVYPDVSAFVGSASSTIAAGDDTRFNPTPSAAGRIAYDTGSGWSALTAGAANALLQSNGAAAPSWTSAPTVSGVNLTDATVRLASLVSQGTSLNAILRWNGTAWGITASPTANWLLTSGASAPTWSNILTGIIFDASVNTLSNVATSMLATGFNLAATQGGTGQTSYAVGDILYASTTTALSKLAAGTPGYVLTAAGASTAPAWAAPITNTAGASSLSSNYNVTGSYVNVGLSASLPSAGKYRVWGEVRCQLQVSVSTGNITIRLYDSTAAAAISNSERISVFSQSSVLAGSTVPISEIITVTGASTIDVQAVTAAGPTYTSAQILSDSSGRSRLFYEKIGP